MIHQTIAHYKILEELGKGGMGVVYKAHDTRLERDVALKFLHPELVRTSRDKKRFLREARTLAALDHTNICTVYELGEAKGHTYIAMAYIEGRELEELRDEGPLSVERSLEIVRQVAMGLRAAHGKNVIHRDIKSANIIVTPNDDIKILDFGLARIADQTRLTAEGTAMGTVAYMSPEQATGATVDHRTDIWSLGVLLYELITGEYPFFAEFPQAIIYLIINGEPKPLAHYRDDIPAGVQEIIDGALSKNVDTRIQSADEFIVMINGIISSGAGTTSTPIASAQIEPAPAAVTEHEANTVAILDFTNRTEQPNDDWLSGGIAETLTADLKRIASLQVITRETIAKVDQRSSGDLAPDEAIRIGRTLGAKWLIWGDHLRLGESIRITSHFSDSTSGEVVHSCKVDGSTGEIFKLQDQIITKFVEIIDKELSGSELEMIQKDETEEEKAYELYARARQRSNQMGIAGFEETRELYERAIAIDPGYALAYSGLGAMHVLRFIAETDPQMLEKGKEYLTRAIEIDSGIAEPHGYMAYYYGRKGDAESAVASCRKALSIEENHVMAHYLLGTNSVMGSGFVPAAEGVQHLRRTIELAPSHQPARMALSMQYTLHGHYDRALPLLEEVVEMQNASKVSHFRFVGGMTLLGNLFFRQRRLDRAQMTYRKALEDLEPSDHMYKHMFVAQTYCGIGDVEYVRGNYDKAVKHFGRAVDYSNEWPKSLAIGYFYMRGCAGLSKSFFQLAVEVEAHDKAKKAVAALQHKKDHNFSAGWEAIDPLAYFHLASCHTVLLQVDDAIRCLSEAVRLGWRDLPQIEADEDLRVLERDPRFEEIVQTLRSTEPLP